MVGTHFPDDRDVLESALQRMREAFEALRDGRMAPARAEEEFLSGYDTARDLVSAFFLARRMSPGGPAAADELWTPCYGFLVMDSFECALATLAACRSVLGRLTADDLARPSPCAEYTVGEVGEHVVRSMVLLASVAGGSLAGAGAGSGEGGLDERVTLTAEAALAAWRRRGLDGSVAVGRSTLPASLAVEIIPLELLVHGWDMARATGSGIDVPPEIAEYVLGRAQLLVTPDKRGRSFAAEVPAGPSATVLERLIAFTGREP